MGFGFAFCVVSLFVAGITRQSITLSFHWNPNDVDWQQGHNTNSKAIGLQFTFDSCCRHKWCCCCLFGCLWQASHEGYTRNKGISKHLWECKQYAFDSFGSIVSYTIGQATAHCKLSIILFINGIDSFQDILLKNMGNFRLDRCSSLA